MTMTELRDLPEDLVEDEILCHVPATHLKRIGSTCKRWNRLFMGDGRFARKHIYKAAKEFLVLTLNKSYRICEMSVDLDGSVEVKRKVSLVDPYSNGAELDISQVFHCDGLLLCKSEGVSRFAVWNPFTDQIMWFQYKGENRYHCLGYYHKSSNNKSYKILSFDWSDLSKGFEIYELSSDSARILYGNIIPPGWTIKYSFPGVSLKGNTYLFARDGKRTISLLKFDYSTEKFEPFPLPYQRHSYCAVGISVVRDEKLSVLLECQESKTEIWVTNKITQSQVVSWSKILTLDLSPADIQLCHDTTFLLDEEKKVVMICDRWLDMEDETKSKDMIYIVGEDNRVTQVAFGVDLPGECKEAILNYVPSFVQIKQAGGRRTFSNM